MSKKFFFIIAFLILLNQYANLTAQANDLDKLITDIKVRENKLISTSTILSKIKIKIGSVFSQNVLNEDIKNLYATGYFTDISVDLGEYESGVAVTFIVTEKALLKEIIFKGNVQIRADRLKKLIESEIDQPLDYMRLKQDIAKIKAFYIKEGYNLVLVEEEVLIDRESGEARVFILVDESKRYRIKAIKIEGNKAISAKEILKSIKTRRDTLLTSGFFSQKQFDADIKIINKLYTDRGYSSVSLSYEVEYDKDKGEMALVVKIEEGSKYMVGEIKVKGNEVVSEEEIRDVLTLSEGSTYIPDSVEKDVAAINEIYFEKGYISAGTAPDVIFNKELQQMNITYSIEERERVYIERIEIRGNDKTKDIVIRRELAVTPGGVFDGKKLRRSKRNLNNLGYFEEITYDTEPGSAPNKKNLIVNVKETKTGEVSFGAGYSSVDKFIGFVELRQRNFDYKNFPTLTGDGQQVTVRCEFGSEKKRYDLSFTEPWLFNKPVSFGFDLYNRYRSRDIYEENRLGGDLRLGWRFGDNLRLNSMYKLEEIELGDIPDWITRENVPDVWEEEGRNTLSSFSLTLIRDTRDNVFNPKSGGTIENSIEATGGLLGGDREFIKYYSDLNWYFTHFEKFTFEVRLRGGVADKYNGTNMVPIYERFYAGGANTIRGYRERHVGPKKCGEPVGGNSMLIGNLEYTFPVMKNIKGAVFYDVGNVWSEVRGFADGFKSGAGLGVRVKTPIGPVKLDYGFRLSDDPGDKKDGRFHFSMSRGF